MPEQTFVNIYQDADGRYIGDTEYPSYEDAFESRDDLTTYIETVEIIRKKQ